MTTEQLLTAEINARLSGEKDGHIIVVVPNFRQVTACKRFIVKTFADIVEPSSLRKIKFPNFWVEFLPCEHSLDFVRGYNVTCAIFEGSTRHMADFNEVCVPLIMRGAEIIETE